MTSSGSATVPGAETLGCTKRQKNLARNRSGVAAPEDRRIPGHGVCLADGAVCLPVALTWENSCTRELPRLVFRRLDLAGVSSADSIPKLGLVAQSVEQRPFKPLVLGSSPSQPTIKFRDKAIPKLRFTRIL